MAIPIWAVVVGLLYLTKRHDYLLFHPLAEIFSVAVAIAIFMLVWNVRRSLENSFLIFVGVAYLSIGCVDMVHTLAYQGMGVFERYETNLQTQLWIAGRYMQSLSFLLGAFFLGRRLKPELVLVGYVVATSLLLGTIFYWDVFPACVAEGGGQTFFKKLSNYAIILILAASVAMLIAKRAQFDRAGLGFIIASIMFIILSELCISFLTDVYGIPYFLGHLFKVISYYCIYIALIELGMSKPLAVLFRNLKESEETLRRARDELEQRVQERTGALVKANTQLSRHIKERKRAEGELLVERNKLRSILEALTDGVYIVNQQYDIEYTNPVIEKEFGPVVKDRKCYEYFHDRMEICPWCKNQEVFSGKRVQSEWHYIKTGKTYDVVDTPLFNTRGTVSKMKILHDITHRKQTEQELRESEKQLQELSSQLLTAQESERSRIARELHDELGGTLAVLKLRTSLIEKNLQPDQTAIREQCKENLQYIDEIIDNVHRLSRNLSPSILEDIGLTPALRWLIDNFVRYYGVKAIPDIEDVDHWLPGDDKIMIYRIFQEALTNIGKHAQAGNVAIKVKTCEGGISFFIEDDGRGFDLQEFWAKPASEKGLGLATMSERSRMLGGSVQLQSKPGNGTRIALFVPIKKGERS